MRKVDNDSLLCFIFRKIVRKLPDYEVTKSWIIPSGRRPEEICNAFGKIAANKHFEPVTKHEVRATQCCNDDISDYISASDFAYMWCLA